MSPKDAGHLPEQSAGLLQKKNLKKKRLLILKRLKKEKSIDTKGLGDMCENFHITFISTPARHRQSFGAIERGNQVIKNCLNEVINSRDYKNMSTDEMLAIAQLINNGFVSNHLSRAVPITRPTIRAEANSVESLSA